MTEERELSSVFGSSMANPSAEMTSDPEEAPPTHVTPDNLEPTQDEMERERLMAKAEQLQDEILELRKQLSDKEMELAEVKHDLGITPYTEFKQSMSHGWDVLGTKFKGMQETDTYRKIDSTLSGWKTRVEDSNAYQKTVTTISDGSTKAKGAISSAGSKIKENEKVKAMGEGTSTFIKRTGTKISTAASSLKEKVWTSVDQGDEQGGDGGGGVTGQSDSSTAAPPTDEQIILDEPTKKD